MRAEEREAVPRDRPPLPFSPEDPWLEERLRRLHKAGPPRPLLVASNVREGPRLNTRYRGILRDVRSNAWGAKIKVRGKTWYLGSFKDEKSAAWAYDCAAYFVLGEKAVLNFPNEKYDEFTAPPKPPPPWIVQHVQSTGEPLSASFEAYMRNQGEGIDDDLNNG